MLQRLNTASRLAAAARLAAEGQGAALWQGFCCQQQCQQQQQQQQGKWQAHAPLLPHRRDAVAAAPAGGVHFYTTSAELAERKPGQQEDFIYQGPFANAVKRVKKLSLFSCACALGAGPIIMGMDATTTLTAKVSIVATLASFGVFTTGLLTWFTQPYIQTLRYEWRGDTVEATTLTLLAKPRTDRFHLSEVREADSVHPLTSFRVRGRLYYVDAEHFGDKALLARLVPQAAAAQAMQAGEAAIAAAQQQHPASSGDQQQASSQ